jgi:hypothetical protein
MFLGLIEDWSDIWQANFSRVSFRPRKGSAVWAFWMKQYDAGKRKHDGSQSGLSEGAPPIERTTSSRNGSRFHQMAGFGEAAFVDVGAGFTEGCEYLGRL